jgi:hypothetical protein
VNETVEHCRLLDFPKIHDPRGNLTFVEGDAHVPFAIRRVYWIYGVPGGERRGGHAYRELHEVIVAVSGSFEVHVDDGVRRRSHLLNRGYAGLYVPNMIWRELDHFSTNAVCLILASARYDPADYVRDKVEYLTAQRVAR